MRICLLTDQYLDADPFDPDDWPCDPRPFLPEAEWALLTLEKDSAVAQIVEASREGFDVFFNLCDGAWDEGRVGIEVVQALEWLDVPFTGATSEFFEPSREAMKRVCHAYGIDTPAYAIARTDAEVEVAAETLQFPLFVKHPSSYASNGLTRKSRVEDVDALRSEAREKIRLFGAALIEEFIDGTECTVLVAENPDDVARPTSYRPIEYRFPEGETFKHYDLKWVNYDGLDAAPVTDPRLDARLRDAAERFFVGMRGASFGRCDFRVDETGRPFMLEINPNCGVYYPETDPGSADLCLLHDPAGHEGFTRQLVEAALRRHGRRKQGWRVLPRPQRDYGSFVTRDVRAGEVVMAFEEGAHHLVSRTHVEAHWDEDRRARFQRHAWPLTDDVWVVWGDDPETWTPINHSCDPSAWLEGLNVVARRDMKTGEEITLEYATLYDERMASFACTCDAPACRGTICGTDYREAFVSAYGEHVSAHIRRKRADLGRLAGHA